VAWERILREKNLLGFIYQSTLILSEQEEFLSIMYFICRFGETISDRGNCANKGGGN
jgi:hypothetical protein